MASDALELVRLRNNFYRDNYRRLMALLLMMSISLIVLVVGVVWLVTHRPQPKYFAATQSGRMLEVVPLNRPTLSSKALLDWAGMVATGAYTYSFINYRTKIQELESSFTTTGWKNFSTALTNSDNISAVEQRKLMVSAVVSGAPVIAHEGLLNGRYAWRVQIPLVVTYQSSSQRFDESHIVTMVIIRISTLQNESGIGIEQFVVS